MELFLSGLASGFDWKSVVDQLADVQRAPQRRLRAEQSGLYQVQDALTSLATEFEGLLAKAKALRETQLYNTRGVSSTDKSVATASVGPSGANGSHSLTITRLASAARQLGADNAGSTIDAATDVTSTAAGFNVSVTSGNFTINGQQIGIQASDTLNDVLARINSQTGLAANYDSGADRITLSDSGGQPIVLGSAADTSNFLQATRLTNNGTDTVTSSHQLGGVKTSAVLDSARFNASVTSGTFSINGVSFSVNAVSDTVSDVLDRINQSAAGVVAGYDSVNDRFTLTNKVTGDIGISLAEGTSNFLSATKLAAAAGGALANGSDAEFTLDGGGTLTSHTNALGVESHGIEGLTVNALTSGSTTISVASDSSALREAITGFVDQYNKVQSLIAIQSASSTDDNGHVTAGTLAGDTQVSEGARRLRDLFVSDAAGLSGTIKRLESLGFATSGYSNEISADNPGLLDAALANSLDDVQALFADEAGGIATQASRYLESLVGFDGSLVRHRDTVARESGKIDEQVAQLEKAVLASRSALIESFRAMEKTLAHINQQTAFFTQRFGIT